MPDGAQPAWVDLQFELLQPLLESAFAVARRDASTPGNPRPPGGLRPFLQFDRISDRVLRRVADVLDTDSGFRERVIEAVGLAESPDADESNRVERASEMFGLAGRLYLLRLDGWDRELAELVEGRAEQLAAEEDSAAARRAEDRLPQVETMLADVRQELEEVDARLSESTAELDAERARRRSLEGELDEVRRRAEDAAEDRNRAVKDLVDAKKISDRRLEQLRAAEAQLQAAPQHGTDALRNAVESAAGAQSVDGLVQRVAELEAALELAEIDRQGAADALRSVARIAGDLTAQLGVALDEALGRLGAPTPSSDSPALLASETDRFDDGPVPAMAPPRERRARRVPTRLRHGAIDGTNEATMQLLGLPNVVVLVDGYNVSMSGWRHLQGPEQRHALISGVSDLTARTGADFRIVFDGDSDGARPTVSVASPVRIYFTAASEEADDAILRMITEVPDNQPIVVVSSDHRVQDGARRRGANVVASADLLAAIRH